MLCLLAIVAVFLVRLMNKYSNDMESIKTRYLIAHKVWTARTILGFEGAQTTTTKDSKRPPLSDTVSHCRTSVGAAKVTPIHPQSLLLSPQMLPFKN